MLYLPNKTYKEISSLDLRYNVLLKELAVHSKEIQKLKDQTASFDVRESEAARGKLRKIVEFVMGLRGHANQYPRLS